MRISDWSSDVCSSDLIDCDRIGFDQGATAGLGFCDDEPEQPPHSPRTAKGWRRFNRGQFLFYPCSSPLRRWRVVSLRHWPASLLLARPRLLTIGLRKVKILRKFLYRSDFSIS